MNLLDYASIAVPTCFTDMQLLSYAQTLHHAQDRTLGAKDWPLPALNKPTVIDDHTTQIVVCGAHMQSLPLNHKLTDRGATLVEQCQSSADYKLLALPGGPPQRPGMLRVNENGKAIKVEV